MHTRTGRPFFPDALTTVLVDRVRAAVTTAGLWADLDTDWLLFDAELLPWSAKATALIREQYAGVGAAASAALPPTLDVLDRAAARGLEVAALRERTASRAANAALFTEAYRRYVRPTDGLAGVTLAPFALLAAEGANLAVRDNGWHLAQADRLVAADPELFTPTDRRVVDLADPATVAAATQWWVSLTAAGGEGMVVKPYDGLVRLHRGGFAQPGIKCRGREYLRIIYGPDYTSPEELARLRDRNIGRKRGLALREHALGLGALDRAAAGEPLWRVHQLVFGVLALESEPVDPRL